MSLPLREDACWVGGSWLYWVVCYCLRGAAQFTQCSAPHIMNLSFIWTVGLCSTQCLVFLCLQWCYANEVSIEQNCRRWMTTLLWLGHQEGSGLWQEYVFTSPSPVKADLLTFLHGLYPGSLLDCRAWGFVPSSPLPNSLPSDAFKGQQLLLLPPSVSLPAAWAWTASIWVTLWLCYKLRWNPLEGEQFRGIYTFIILYNHYFCRASKHFHHPNRKLLALYPGVTPHSLFWPPPPSPWQALIWFLCLLTDLFRTSHMKGIIQYIAFFVFGFVFLVYFFFQDSFIL